MSLVEHARRELELCGQTAEDPDYAASVVAAVEAFASFASYGHSGGSAGVAVEQLHRLLKHEPLSPITDDPEEWEDRTEVSGKPWWQNRRDSRAMSHDGGKTWWYVEGRHAGERCKDGGVWGVLEKCRECSGDGLLHRADGLPEPDVRPLTAQPAAALRRDLAALLNRWSMENRSNTPDFILAEYLVSCLEAFDGAVNERSSWYGRHDAPGQAEVAA